MRASACCSRAVCRRSEEQLDLSEIGILIEQVGGEAVTRSVEAPVLFESEFRYQLAAAVVLNAWIDEQRLGFVRRKSSMPLNKRLACSSDGRPTQGPMA